MIRISKYFYIHWLFVVLGVFCYITRQLEVFFISFLIMSVHEMAHLISAKCLGLSILRVTIYPFGVNLKLKNTILRSFSDELILYLSGPLSNVFMALCAIPFFGKNDFVLDFYYKNIALFLINMLPIMPLDGGMILKKYLNYQFGYDAGKKVMSVISAFMIMVVLFCCGMLLYIGRFNSSLCIFLAFIIGNVLVSKEKYNQNFLKELMWARRDKIKPYKAKVIGADENVDELEIVKKFCPSRNYFVVICDCENRVKKVMSDQEVVTKILEKN